MGMKSNGEKTAAIVLAAGRGSRMGGDIHKQFMLLGGKPLVYYSLKAFAEKMCIRYSNTACPLTIRYPIS